jgi:hypothetical protein
MGIFFASRNAITKQRGVATALLRASSLTDARENKHNHMLTNRGHTLHFFEMQMGLHEAGKSMMCCFWSADTLSNDSIAKSDQSIALMPRRSSPIFWHRPRLDAMCANKLPRLYLEWAVRLVPCVGNLACDVNENTYVLWQCGVDAIHATVYIYIYSPSLKQTWLRVQVDVCLTDAFSQSLLLGRLPPI